MERPPMPAGPLGPPFAWDGPALAATPELWRWSLSADTLQGLERATEAIVENPQGWRNHDRPAVRTPELGRLARRIQQELLEGRGFVVLTGLPVEEWSTERSAAAFWILGQHLGRPVPQNAQGHLLGHVTDLGYDADDPTVRIYQTAERQHFHTDSADAVGLLCLRAARSGGRSSLVSIAAAHDRLVERCPDLVPTLFEPIATDQRGEPRKGERPFFTIPVLSWFSGRLLGCYQRRYIESARRFPDALALTAKQVEALDALDSVLEELRLDMDLRPGDMQFIHNHSLFHDRTAFQDWPDPKRRRHLLRLWLCPDTGWALPPTFAERYGSLEVGARGGVEPRCPVSTPLSPESGSGVPASESYLPRS